MGLSSWVVLCWSQPVISMWVMNTSTTLMLLPIGLAVCASVAETIPNFSAKQRKNFETSLLLGIAYAASIGGMSTLVGTAPNIIFAGFMQETYGIEISFIDWMKLGVPIASIMLCCLLVYDHKICLPR